MTELEAGFDVTRAPMHIGGVQLRVRDLDRVSQFYQMVLGLVPVAEGQGETLLGIGNRPLLTLRGDPSLSPRNPREAGLYHTAFLLPQRADLARWLHFVLSHRVLLQGASDHIVSEAIYLADPEGNGIEVYTDRPPSAWTGPDGAIVMSTDPLDAEGLLREANGEWTGFPERGLIGHVHLQVGDTEAATRFYGNILGFDLMLDYPGARFFGSGGYHHQLAGNVWHSRNAGRRTENTAGLSELTVLLADPAMLAGIESRAAEAGIAFEHGDRQTLIRDPWGTAIRLVA